MASDGSAGARSGRTPHPGLTGPSRALAVVLALAGFYPAPARAIQFRSARGQAVPATQQQAPAALQQALPAVPASSPASTRPVAPAYLVLLDAAHGGADTGVRLSDHLLEKDFTLALSVRLRSTLSAHGITVLTTRESDANSSPELRAAAANRTHASACLLLHATASGSGVHLYTSSLAAAPLPPPGEPRPWATAQAGYLTQSLKLSSDVSEALGHAGIPVTLGSVSLRQIDSMACPAILLEVAPLAAGRGRSAATLDDPAYRTRLIDALAGALEQWRADWKMQP